MRPRRVRAGRLALTEQHHPHGRKLEQLAPLALLRRMHAQDLVAVRALSPALPSLARLAEHTAEALRAGGRLFYVGAGTSGRLGALDAAECPPTFGTSPQQVQAIMAGGPRAFGRAIEGAEDDVAAARRALQKKRVGELDVVVGLSASGSTGFVRAALEEARRRGAHTALLTSNPRASRAHVQTRVVLRTGPELLAGSTRLKAGTATKLALNALSTATMVLLGRVREGRMVHLRATNLKLAARSVRMVRDLAGVSAAEARRVLKQSRGRVAAALQLLEG